MNNFQTRSRHHLACRRYLKMKKVAIYAQSVLRRDLARIELRNLKKVTLSHALYSFIILLLSFITQPWLISFPFLSFLVILYSKYSFSGKLQKIATYFPLFIDINNM